jgi:glycosyltransferase involved in cell wall biosynthesis
VADLKKLIIVPAYNEEESIMNTVAMLKRHDDFDFIVINDGSTDKTENLLIKNDIKHISLIENLGIGGAMQTGYEYALLNGYDIAVQVDADGQHNPEFLNEFIAKLVENNCDMVIGSRYIEGEGFQSTVFRRIGKNILSGLIKILTGTKMTDPTSGFRACNRSIIYKFAVEYPADYPEPETIVELLVKGYRLCEIPVLMNERDGGISSITTFKSFYYMIKVTMAILLSYFSNRKKAK